MELVFKIGFFEEFYGDNLKYLNYKEQSFLESILKYNHYKEEIELSPKQKQWYLDILRKYLKGKIKKGSMGEKMLKGKKLESYSEKHQEHILTYGDVFTINKNIQEQLK